MSDDLGAAGDRASVAGLPDGALLSDRLDRALAHALRRRMGLAVGCFSIDGYSALVGPLGPGAGDDVLAELGRRFAAAVRAEDTVAYLGDGHFGLLLPGAAGPHETSTAVAKVLGVLTEPVRAGDQDLELTASLGIAVFPTDGTTAAELLGNAETAMERAADRGAGSWRFHRSTMNSERDERLEVETELRDGLEREEFRLHYQPVVSAENGTIVAMEALLRWVHPERGLVLPMQFLSLAEESGLIVPLGEWVLDEACRQVAHWSLLGWAPHVNVNLSARELHDPGLTSRVARSLERSGLSAQALRLEVTETAIMEDARSAEQALALLHSMGVVVALDDFGTSYASLAGLVRLPVGMLKIDRSLVARLHDVHHHDAFVGAAVATGHSLGMSVVAEGVETKEELGHLRQAGCDGLQGYLLGRPLPPAQCTELLRRGAVRLRPAGP